MRVAHISPSFYPALGYGGPIEASYQLCLGLARAGAEVRILTTDADGRSRMEERSNKEIRLAAGVEAFYSRRRVRHTVSPELLRRLPGYIRWADVVHLTGVYSFPTVPTLTACRVLGKPLIWSPRGALQRWKGSRRRFAKSVWETGCRAVTPKTLLLHVTSEDEARETKARFPYGRVQIVPNGVSVPTRTRHIGGNGELRLLYLGRLDPIKGVENLLEACALAQQDFGVCLRLTIAGEGDTGYMAALRQRVRELGIDDVIRMYGWADGTTKGTLFETTDVLVLPSHKESFGMVAAEALSYGVPLIASRGTPWRQVEEVGCGLWVENDPASLASAIHRVRGLPLSEMGRRGRDWMSKEFDWSCIAARMLALYRAACEGRDD